MLVTGFTLALRPSSLRPLRHRGPCPDVLRQERLLLIRRSHTNLVDQLKVAEALQRSISGHATAAMADRYRSQQQEGQREVMGQIIDLAGIDLAGVRAAKGQPVGQVGQPVGQVS